MRQRVAHAQLAGEGVQGLEYEELTGEVAVDKLLLKLLHATLKVGGGGGGVLLLCTVVV